jgi:hypothetical protein
MFYSIGVLFLTNIKTILGKITITKQSECFEVTILLKNTISQFGLFKVKCVFSGSE